MPEVLALTFGGKPATAAIALLLVGVAAGKGGSAVVMIGGATADEDGKVLVVGVLTAAATTVAAAVAIMVAGNAGVDGKDIFEPGNADGRAGSSVGVGATDVTALVPAVT